MFRDSSGKFIKGGKYPKEWSSKRIRPKGLLYAIKVRNRGWFKGIKGFWIDERGYRKIRVNGLVVREHRFIMENYLGRKLEKNEIVHHRDGDKLNNCLSNLEVMSKSDHDKLHNGKKLHV